jgi:tRNA threonylcarbamoyl adenosine modification protein (Sua5/YciO/YrdC/YwlC family)
VLSIGPDLLRGEPLRQGVAVLRRGGVLGLPTETFYGLAVDAFDVHAVSRLDRLKGRPEHSPVLLLVADLDQVRQVARELPRAFGALSQRFWPGPLTLVVPAADRLPEGITGGTGTVGLRVPGHSLPRRLAAALGHPITGVSANRHGEPPCRTAGEVAEVFGEGLDLILDGGPTSGGAPSTVVDLTGPEPRVLRAGAIPSTALDALLPDLGRAGGPG